MVDPKSYVPHQVYRLLPELHLAVEGLPDLCAHGKPLFIFRRCYADIQRDTCFAEIEPEVAFV